MGANINHNVVRASFQRTPDESLGQFMKMIIGRQITTLLFGDSGGDKAWYHITYRYIIITLQMYRQMTLIVHMPAQHFYLIT